MRTKAIIRLLFSLGAITWLALVCSDIYIVFTSGNNIRAGMPSWVPNVALNLFILSLYYYYKLRYDRDDSLNFVDLLWRVFATGLVATIVSLGLKLIEYLLGSTRLTTDVIFIDLMYLINLGLMVGFLTMAFTAWKRLILYQKSKWLMRLWNLFEWSLLLSLLYNAFDLPFVEGVFWTMLTFFVVIGLVLSANMKWVAFLNFRQPPSVTANGLLSPLYLFHHQFAF